MHRVEKVMVMSKSSLELGTWNLELGTRLVWNCQPIIFPPGGEVEPGVEKTVDEVRIIICHLEGGKIDILFRPSEFSPWA